MPYIPHIHPKQSFISSHHCISPRIDMIKECFRARNSPGLLIPVLFSINGKFKYLPKLFEKWLEPNLVQTVLHTYDISADRLE